MQTTLLWTAVALLAVGVGLTQTAARGPAGPRRRRQLVAGGALFLVAGVVLLVAAVL
ncbi:hypothetical protein [Ornithinimicrobium sediminis]|uniref:hypothetical protein n=1 Tax=Ornithinimicrobium sediminis TaxID=2904603 RepID=UPI001E366790|nr:hypothetical protein [Ornithinimicrobium sediminis]MCE0486017.1 hypothetical protein [Ornithinimicrobium sediminis]